MQETAGLQRIVVLYPLLFLRRKRPVFNAFRGIFRAEDIQISGLIGQKLRLGSIQLFQQVSPVRTHTEKIIGSAEDRNDLRVFLTIGAVPLHSEHIDLMVFEILPESVIILIGHHFRIDGMAVQKVPEQADSGSVQNADPPVLQRGRIRSDLRVRIMPEQAAGFVPHGRNRISDRFGAVLCPCQTRHKIDLALCQVFIKVGEAAVHILILPARVLCQPEIIFVGISPSGRALRCRLLEPLLLVVPDPHRLALIFLRKNRNRESGRGQNSRTQGQGCPPEKKNLP